MLKQLLNQLKIPKGYGRILEAFSQNNIKCVLFKQTPSINEEIGGLDILLPSDNHYKQAISIAKQQGFIVYFSERNEPYKTMMVHFDEEDLIVIHLHRRVSWLGILYVSEKAVCQNAVALNDQVFVPRPEESVLIHASHILFENYNIRQFEFEIFAKYVNEKLDWPYINSQLKKYKWKKAFFKLKEQIEKKQSRVPASHYTTALLRRLCASDAPRSIYFLAKQALQAVIKRLSLRRKGILISFSGVNGCGKSTMTKKLAEQYVFCLRKLDLPVKTYYYGWIPFFPWTKWLSKRREKQGKKIYKQTADKKNTRVPTFSLKMECFFFYVFVEYLFRYLFHIYPTLRRRGVVISDRYFYHMYGQYPYAEKSLGMKLWLRVFPKPDFVFVLNVDDKLLKDRRKDIIDEHRVGQQKRYNQLPVKKIVMNPMAHTPAGLFDKIYKRYFKKLRY